MTITAEHGYPLARQWWWGIGPVQHVKREPPSFLEVIVPLPPGGRGCRAGDSGELGCQQLCHYSEFNSSPLA